MNGFVRHLLVWSVLALLSVLLSPGLSLAESASPRRLALVIGNSQYDGVYNLPNASSDAKKVADVLRATDFDVELLRDATLAQINDAIDNIAARTGKETETVLFYYAGHGFQLSGVNYLVPRDAVLDRRDKIEERTIRLDSALKRLASPSHQTLIMLDACRNNPLPESVRQGETAVGLAEIGDSPETYVVFATAPGQVTYDGAGDDTGPFAKAFIKYARTPDLPFQETFRLVRKEVAEATFQKQRVWESGGFMEPFSFVDGGKADLGIDIGGPVVAEDPAVKGPIQEETVVAAIDEDDLGAVSFQQGNAAPSTTFIGEEVSEPPPPAPPRADDDPEKVPEQSSPVIDIPVVDEPQTASGDTDSPAVPTQPGIAEGSSSPIELATPGGGEPLESAEQLVAPSEPSAVRSVSDIEKVPATVEPGQGWPDGTVVDGPAVAKVPDPVLSDPGVVEPDDQVTEETNGTEIAIGQGGGGVLAPMTVEEDQSGEEGRVDVAIVDPDVVASPTEPQVYDPKALARITQERLQRVGCYNGEIDGDWGKGSKAALNKYSEAKGIFIDNIPVALNYLKAEKEGAIVCKAKVKVAAPAEPNKPAGPKTPAAPKTPTTPKTPVADKPVEKAKPVEKKTEGADFKNTFRFGP